MPISKIKSSGIEADSVTGSSILDGTVDTADLANGAVTSAKLDTNINVAGTLDVTGATTLDDGLTVDNDGATVATFDRATSDGDIVEFQKGGLSLGSIGNTNGSAPGDLYICSNTASHCGISFSGNRYVPTDNTGSYLDNAVDIGESSTRFKDLYLSGGVYLGGTVSANHLDDYEEGTWTPEVLNGWGILSPTYSTNTGYYTKIGNLVYILFKVVLSGGSTNGNPLVITGLPFNSNATTGGSGIYDTLHGAFTISSSNNTSVFMQLGTNNVNNVQGKYRVGNGTNNFTGTDAGGCFNCTFSGVYRTDA